MLDPSTAIGLASSIVSFVDFSAKLVKGAIEIYDAVDGTLEENRSREAVAAEMRRLAARLVLPPGVALPAAGQERELCVLAAECHKLAEELLALLARVKPRDVASKRQSLWAALKNKFHEGERDELEKRLDACRGQLALHVTIETLAGVSELSARGAEAQAALRQLLDMQKSAQDAAVGDRVLESLAFEGMHGRYDMVDAAHEKTFRWIFHAEGRRGSSGSDSDSWSSSGSYSWDSDDAAAREEEENDEGSLQGTDENQREEDEDEDDDEPVASEGSEKKENAEESLHGTDGSEEKEDESESDDSTVASEGSVDRRVLDRHAQVIKEGERARRREEIRMRQEARETFLQWLSSGTGIFHISGKMGSGKSTLMKYLGHHPETQRRLEEWAGSCELVVASFYFWRPGSDLQKSLSGLYRSLLHDVLESHPELISSVLPGVWKRAMAASSGTQTKLELREEDIRQGFTRLIGTKELCGDRCFCFFIDGLDEFQTSAQHDNMDMVRQLSSWASAFPSNVKLCVSSREYNVFMKTFSASQRLRLHTLTQYDIEAYVRDRLTQIEDEKETAALTKSIVERAGGVFFWVTLVVRQIREQLLNGVEPPHLVGILSELPDELDDLYRHIIQTLDKYSRKRMFQTLAMMPFLSVDINDIHLDLLAYSFLDNYNADPEFARRDEFEATLAPMRANLQKRRDLARDRLTGWCRGLVELDSEGRLGYAHRSVADFIEAAADLQAQMTASINGVHPVSMFSELILARMKLFTDHDHDLMMYPYFNLLLMRQRYDLDHAPYPFLRCADTVWEGVWDQIDDPSFRGIVHIRLGRSAWMVAASQASIGEDHQTAHVCLASYFFRYLNSNDYALWKITTDPTTTDTTSKAVVLFYVAASAPPNYPVVDVLLERGIITPATRTHLVSFITEIQFETTRIEMDIAGGRSVWQNFLIERFYSWLCRKDYHAEEAFGGGIAERLLRHGADPRFRFATLVLQPPDAKMIRPAVEDTFYFGDSDRPETVCHRRVWRMAVGNERLSLDDVEDIESLDATFSKIRTWPYDPATRRREISLRGWIVAMDYFSGKEALLQLVDDRLHELERTTRPGSEAVSIGDEETGLAPSKPPSETEAGDIHEVRKRGPSGAASTLPDDEPDLDTNASAQRTQPTTRPRAMPTESSTTISNPIQSIAFPHLAAIVLLIISAIVGYSRLQDTTNRSNTQE